MFEILAKFFRFSGKENEKPLKIDIAVAELMEICLRVIQYKISDIQMQNEINE